MRAAASSDAAAAGAIENHGRSPYQRGCGPNKPSGVFTDEIPMLRIKVVEVRLGIIVAASAALLLCSAQGCSRLPFGHSTTTDAVPDDPIVSAAVPPPAMVASPELPQGGALVQTLTIPGTTSTESPQTGGLVQTLAIPGTTADSTPGHLTLGIPTNSVATGVVPTTGVTSAAGVVPVVTTIPIGAAGVVKSEMKKFIFHSPAEEARYNTAAAKFPDFCHEWQRMLRDRESNNLSHLTWETRGGVETTTYTGYGQVDGCETKESVEGVPIGKISYTEMIYNLMGKTSDEARHAAPKVIHETHTLEIFSWEKDKWFY
jgi:hypothetical protein